MATKKNKGPSKLVLKVARDALDAIIDEGFHESDVFIEAVELALNGKKLDPKGLTVKDLKKDPKCQKLIDGMLEAVVENIQFYCDELQNSV